MEGTQGAELRFPITAGVLVRGQVIAKIKHAAFLRGLKIDVEEDKGLLESTYKVTVRGEESELKGFKKIIEGWLGDIGAELAT